MAFIDMFKRNRNRLYILVIAAVSIVYLTNLGPSEIQPWDEAIYATMAKSVVKYGAWLDQTEYSLGGLHSGAYPPLYVWLTAINIRLFGDTPLAIRLWSMIFGAATLFIVFFTPANRRVGFFSAVILSLVPYFYFYSRQGQFDVTVAFFVALSFFFWNKYSRTNRFVWLVHVGVSFGLSLMSKIMVGFFIPISFGLFFLIQVVFGEKKFKTFLYQFLVIFGVGAIIALPWHSYMIYKYGYDFIDYYLGFHIFERMFQGIDNKISPLGAFYYPNQYLVMMSAASILVFRNKFKIDDKDGKLLYLIAVLTPLVIYSISISKLQQYMIILFPQISLLAGFGVNRIISEKKADIPTVIATAAIYIWAFSQTLRNDVKEMFASCAVTDAMIFSFAAFVVLYAIIFLTRKRKIYNVFVAGVFIFLFLQIIVNPREAYLKSKIEDFARGFKSDDIQRLTYIDSRYRDILVNPQISYYFGFIGRSWESSNKFKFINVDKTKDIQDIKFADSTYVIIAAKQMHERNSLVELHKRLLREGRFSFGDKCYYYYKIID